MNQKGQETVKEVIDCINKYITKDTTDSEIIEILSTVLFSVGYSLAGCSSELTSYQILEIYSANPSLGPALMAQAMYMKETWKGK